jgi:hypothetical protein
VFKVETGKMGFKSWLLLLLILTSKIDAFVTVGIPGVPWMYLNDEGKIILSGGTQQRGFYFNPNGWYDYQQEIYLFDPDTNVTTFMAGSPNNEGQQDGTGGNAFFRSLRGSIVPYQKSNEGYLIADRCAIRYFNSSAPSTVYSPLGNNNPVTSCDTMGAISSLSVGTNKNGYIYVASDYDFNVIYSLNGNYSSLTSSIFFNINSSNGNNTNDYNFHNITSILFVDNLKLNNTSVKAVTDNYYDILIVADNNSRISYIYENTLRYICNVGSSYGYISSIKRYGNNFYITKYNESNNSLYIGNDLTNLTKSGCIAPNQYTVDMVLLPNGSLIQSTNISNNMYINNCGLPSYNPKFPSYQSNTKTRGETHSYTKIHKRTRSHTLSQTKQRSLSDTKSKERLSHSNTIDKSDTQSSSKSLSDTSNITRSYSLETLMSSSVTEEKSSSFSKSKYAPRSNTETMSVPPSITFRKTSFSITNKITKNYPSITKVETTSFSVTNDTTITQSNSNAEISSISPSRSLSPTVTIIKKRLKTVTLVIHQVTVVANIIVTPTAVASNVVASFNGIQGGRTSVFLSIISGTCGATRELEIYENPTRTDYVVLGNLGFMFGTTMFLLWFASIQEAFTYDNKVTKEYPSIKEIVIKYKFVDILFIEWGLFLPGFITSFFAPRSNDIPEVICGSVFLIGTLLLLFLGTRKTVLLDHLEANESIFEESVVWLGDELAMPIIEGYTTKFNMWLDLSICIANSFLTVVDDCQTLAIVTICVNILYSLYIIRYNALQPRTMVYSVAISSLGQSIIIIIVITSDYTSFAEVLFYIISVLGIFFLILPLLKEISHHFFKQKDATSNSGNGSNGDDEGNDEPLLVIT